MEPYAGRVPRVLEPVPRRGKRQRFPPRSSLHTSSRTGLPQIQNPSAPLEFVGIQITISTTLCSFTEVYV